MSLESDLEYQNFRREMDFLHNVMTQESHVNARMVDVFTIGLQDIAKRYSLETEELRQYYRATYEKQEVLRLYRSSK